MRIDNCIDLFMDGFYTKEINCIDIPMAACCSIYSRDNYFFYVFLLIMSWNFLNNSDDWLYVRKRIISVLYGKMYEEPSESVEDTFNTIVNALKNNNLVLCIFKYGALPYSRYYRTGTYDHGVIICGIDEEKEIFKIADRELIRQYIDEGIFTADVVATQWISFAMLKQIILESEHMFCDNNDNMTEHYRKTYIIENSMKAIGWREIKAEVCEMIKSNFHNGIREFIKNMNTADYLAKANMQSNRRKYYLSLEAMTRILTKYSENDRMVQDIWKRFLDNRHFLIDKIYKSIYANDSCDNLEEFLSLDEQLAFEFFDVLGESNG